MLLSTHNVGLAWFAGPGREGIDHIGRIPSFLLLRNFEGDERMRHYGLDEQINHGLRVKMCVWLTVSRGLDLAFLNAD